MAQCKVTSYYNTRKRVHESKIPKQNTKAEAVTTISDKLKLLEDPVKSEAKVKKTVSDRKIKKGSAGPVSDSGEVKARNATKRSESKTKKVKPKTNARAGKGGLKGKSSAGEGCSDIRKVFQTQKGRAVAVKQETEEGILILKEETNEVSEVRAKSLDDISVEQSTEVTCQTETVPTTPKKRLKGLKKETEKNSSKEVVSVFTTEQRVESSTTTETVPTTPKRTLKCSELAVLSKKCIPGQDINPLDSRSPQKKLHLEDLNPVESRSPQKKHLENLNLLDAGSPQKKARTVLASSNLPKEGRMGTSQQLDVTTPSPTEVSNPTEKNSKVTVTNFERSKILNSGKLDVLKERLAKFDKSLSALKEAENNKCKITAVISAGAGKSSQTEAKPPDIRRSTPAYERFHYLATTDAPSLTLPLKYKWLSEMFRCSDIVVSMLHNRKEICSFFKLKNSVQDMMKRNFTKNHLGQIRTVFPLAYLYTQEKFHSSSLINPKPGISQYQLVISPNLKTFREESDEQINKNVVLQVQNLKANKNQPQSNVNKQLSNHEQTSTPNSFVQMNPTMLVERKKIFDSNLLKIVKKHHQDFLARLNPPITVPLEKLSRWHYKFPLDSVPDIEPFPLPEPIDVPKCHTAMDVLNKVKGTVSEKIEKALQSVADKNSSSDATDKSKVDAKGIIKTGSFKGISNNLLQRIRAREASKVVQEMTMPPEEKKKNQMMERLPEMVRIIRNYFLTARKAAISVEDATKKIMDSYHSALPQEDVKVHIQLLAEIFPKWLSLVTIPKGVFLKIDKNMDINIMLDTITKK